MDLVLWMNADSGNKSIDFLPCGEVWNGTTMGDSAPLSTSSATIGYICCGIAVLLYGSNFVPFKFVKTGDGIFAQWVMCAGIFIIGVIIQLIREQPMFFPTTLIGGAIWTIGNCCAVPIINLMGLSLGLLIWNCFNVLLGWATGRFGMFGLCPEVPSNEVMNYIGVALVVLA